jgi:hypothetical protein
VNPENDIEFVRAERDHYREMLDKALQKIGWDQLMIIEHEERSAEPCPECVKRETYKR